MNLRQMKRDSMNGMAAGIEPQYTAREMKRRVAATLKHWAYLGATFIPHPDWHPEMPGSLPGLKGFYLNATLSVQVFDAPGGVTHLMIRRHDNGKEFPWYALQHVKNAICGDERVAVEVFPPESELVDQANMRHLWVYPAGHQLGFGL